MTRPSQLCQLAGNWSGRDPPFNAVVESKIDGWRALWLRNHESQPGLYTRNGYRIHGAGHIEHLLLAIEREAGEPLFLDGEFQVNGNLADTKRWCESGWKAGGEAGELFLFDCLTRAEWMQGGSERPLHERKQRLGALWAAVAANLGKEWTWRPGSYGRDEGKAPVHVLPHAYALTAGDVIDQAMKVWRDGGEGLVIKDMLAPYQRNRSDAWLKVGRPWQDKLGLKLAA